MIHTGNIHTLWLINDLKLSDIFLPPCAWAIYTEQLSICSFRNMIWTNKRGRIWNLFIMQLYVINMVQGQGRICSAALDSCLQSSVVPVYNMGNVITCLRTRRDLKPSPGSWEDLVVEWTFADSAFWDLPILYFKISRQAAQSSAPELYIIFENKGTYLSL